MPYSSMLRRASLLVCLGFSIVLAGCGVGVVSTTTTGTLAMGGRVHGGLQPITGAAIELFAVGSGGNGSQATSLLHRPVYTDSGSYFNITGDYTCASPGEQVYLVARGGNPGFSGNVNNNALVLLSALGSCGELISNPNRFVFVNEVSTVAAVFALAPFMTAYDHVGASATNTTGVTNAFLDAQLLANTATGELASLPSNLSVEGGKLYALADAIAPCVNSDGGSACAPLFQAATPSGATAPTNVVNALLNIVKNPGTNVGRVFDCIASVPPYPTPLTSAPHDWTMSLTVSGGGISGPTTLGVDVEGNVWVANYGDTGADSGLVGYSPQGTPLAGSPFGVNVQTEAYGMTLDKNGDVWVVSKEANNTAGGTGSVAKFHGASSTSPGALVGIYSDASIYYPQAVAADPNGSGTIIVANYARGDATIFDLTGRYVGLKGYDAATGGGYSSFPIGVSSDDAGGVWFADQGGSTITHALSNGTIKIVSGCCYAAQTVKLDRHANVWVTNFDTYRGNYTFSEVSSSGQILIGRQSGGGLYAPGGAAVDAGGQFWVTNFYDDSITEIAGNDTSVPAGTPLSTFAWGKDANLVSPFSIAPDQSGNLWIANEFGDTLTMLYGLATPTANPATPIPAAP